MVTQNTLRTRKGKYDFLENNFIFATAVDLSKCLKIIKFSISLYTCAPNSELPSNISKMAISEYLVYYHLF